MDILEFALWIFYVFIEFSACDLNKCWLFWFEFMIKVESIVLINILQLKNHGACKEIGFCS